MYAKEGIFKTILTTNVRILLHLRKRYEWQYIVYFERFVSSSLLLFFSNFKQRKDIICNICVINNIKACKLYKIIKDVICSKYYV